MSGPSIVQLRSLTHAYGERVAVSQVDLAVAPGSVFALLGPNGSGKTTLFKILATLLTPSSGTAEIAGLDVVRGRDNVRRRIGVVFQSPSLDEKLTVAENLSHQGHLYGLKGASLGERRAEVLERFGLEDRAPDRAETLSGGLKRRVELAKALLHRPDVLILDEPSTGLDPAARLALMDHLTSLRDQDGVTTLLTTHLMDEADRADVVAILDQGELVACDSPSALKHSVGGEVLTVQARDPAGLAVKVAERFDIKADSIDDVVRIERDDAHAFVTDLIEAFPGDVDSVTVGRPTLEDVFIHLTGHRLHDAGESVTARKGGQHDQRH